MDLKRDIDIAVFSFADSIYIVAYGSILQFVFKNGRIAFDE